MTQYTDVPSHARGGLDPAERRILLLTCPCHSLTHMMILVFPAVTIPITHSLGMPLEKVLRISFLMYLAYGVGALPAGYLTDRWQARGLLLGGVFTMGIGMVLAGLLASPTAMSLSLLLVGAGASIYHPAGMALISHTVRKRGYALAINGVYGNLGIVVAPFITGVLTWLFDWRWAFIILGVVCCVTGLLLQRIHVDETPHPAHRDKAGDDGRYVKYFLILCIALVMGGLTYRGNTVLLPAYLELKTSFFRTFLEAMTFLRTNGTATLAATTLTSLVFVMGIFGQLLGGRLADRYDLRRAYLFVHAASVPFLLGMAFFTDYLLAICAGMYVFFSLGMQPVENSLVAALTPARWRSTGFAIKFILTFGVGAIAVYLVGAIKTRYSLEAVYMVLAGLAVVLVTSIIALIIMSRRIGAIRN